MKRAILLLFITSACVVGLLSIRGMMPFVPVFDPGTEPALQFFQSRAGMIFTIVALILLALFLYGGAIIHIGNLVLRAIFAPIINEEKNINHALTRQMESTENKINATEQALKEFTNAISQYAQHLSSHTSAIQGLAEASHELKQSAAAQNRVLLDLVKNAEAGLVRKEALLTTMKVNIAPPKKPAPAAGKHRPWKTLPSFRTLHRPVKPTPEITTPAPDVKRTVFEAANLVEAMVLPYYRALYKLEKEKPSPGAEKGSTESEKATARAKKAVEAIMFPFYQTLYQAESENTLSVAEKSTPAIEKPDEGKSPPTHHDPARPHNPWYSRRRHPLKPW